MASIPFEIAESDGNTSQVSGLLFLEDELIVFDVQFKRWGLFTEPREIIKAEALVIDGIRLERGLFKDTLYIVPRRSDLLQAMPGKHKGELKLKVAKRYRDQVQELVRDVLVLKARQRSES